ncbi:MAG: NfeD family protein [Planctomycetota bacterium]
MIAIAVPPPAEIASDVTTIAIAVGLVIAALVFVFLEVLIPSFGLLSAAAIACAVGAVVVAFQVGTTAGVVFLAATALLMPVALYYALRVLRHTVLVTEPMPGGGAGEPAFAPGTAGVTVSVLRPSGAAMIGGKKVSVVTQGEIVEKHSKVEVVRCEGNRVVVRPARA